MTTGSPRASDLRVLRAGWLLAVLLMMLPLGFRAVRLLGSGDDARLMEVVDYLFDDAYYYLQIAANLAETHRSTFDGVTLTNGYQPLWLLLLGGLAAVVGTEPRTLYVAGCLLVYAIAIGAVLLPGLRREHSPDGGSLPMAIGIALAALSGVAIFMQGLETILFLPLAVPLFILIERASEGRGLVALSALLAVAFLVRLDALALAVTSGIVLIGLPVLRRRISLAEGIRRVLRLLVVLLPVVVLYGLVNWWWFGTPVPVSGLAKSFGAPRFANWGVAVDFLAAVRPKVILPLTAAWATLEWLVRGQKGGADDRFYRPMAVVALAIPLQCFYYCAFYGWYAWPWYFYPAALLVALVAARVLHLAVRLDGTARLVGLAAGAMIVARIGLDASRLWIESRPPDVPVASQPVETYGSFNRVSLAMLRDFPPPGRHAWVAMGDRAGGFAYWGRGRLTVAQTEGLVLDRDYLQARVDGRSEAWLEKTFPIDWLVVDRQFVPMVDGGDGQKVYVVPDPVQGRVTRDPVALFCFPAPALAWSLTYAHPAGPTRRMAFDFAARVPCSPAAVGLIRTAEAGIGLRQLSLPGEYDMPGGPQRRILEARDRALHYNSRPLQGPVEGPLQESP